MDKSSLDPGHMIPSTMYQQSTLQGYIVLLFRLCTPKKLLIRVKPYLSINIVPTRTKQWRIKLIDQLVGSMFVERQGFTQPKTKGFYKMHGLLTNGQEQFRPRSHDPSTMYQQSTLQGYILLPFRLCTPKRLLIRVRWLSSVRFNYKPVYRPCDLL